MSPGLYMRDIAEVREGFDSFDFKKNTNAPTDPDLCLSLIGSERTISLELPGKVRALLRLRRSVERNLGSRYLKMRSMTLFLIDDLLLKLQWTTY